MYWAVPWLPETLRACWRSSRHSKSVDNTAARAEGVSTSVAHSCLADIVGVQTCERRGGERGGRVLNMGMLWSEEAEFTEGSAELK